MLKITGLKTEYRTNPIGLDETKPRFSWKLQSEDTDTVQQSYQLIVSDDEHEVWNTGVVTDEQSVHVTYCGEPLRPATRYTVSVSVVDNHACVGAADAWFETGLLDSENFKADWITHGFEDNLEACAIFKKSFELRGAVKSARVYASALGLYVLELNGQQVGDALFSPGWTNYKTRLQYQTYDITLLLGKNNCLSAIVGNGWYKGVLGFYGQGNHYGGRTAFIAQIEICYEDGTSETILTDESWYSTTGAHRFNDIYNGETIDYSLTDLETLPVKKYNYTKDILVGQESEPVRITQRLPAKALIVTPKGEVVIDFGQNMTGVVEARLQYPKGTKITVRHAEALDENGNFYTVNLRTAKATDNFICSGDQDVFRPMFTYHGFRYIQIIGLENEPNLKDFTACVMHSDLAQTGHFECDDANVNRLWQNINWTLRSNYLDVPTDCPQRDERLAYTGDAQIFLSTAVLNKDVATFYQKWMRDLRSEQTPEFGVPMSVPNILGNAPGIAIWHDAATVFPWTLWEAYGDKRFLEDQYESMKACVVYTKGRTGDNGLLQSGQQLGDWVALDMEKGPVQPREGEVWNLTPLEKTGATDVYYIANAYYANSVKILASSARILGYNTDADTYDRLYDEIIGAFRLEYVTPQGRLVSETQTGCAFALHFNLVHDKDRQRILDMLITNLQQHRNHLTTGFAGTQFLCNVLSENGAHDVAGSVFLQEDCPSWLYSVKLGATTVWELWDGVNPDGSFNKYEMNSLNQYALAAIGDWMHKELGGIQMLEPGYKKSRIAPRLIKGITSTNVSLETVYGKLSCAISCKRGQFNVDLQIPSNTTAVVALPQREEVVVGSGTYHYEYATELSFEKDKYTKDSHFGEILDNPLGKQMLEQYAPDLLANEMFVQFAKQRTVIEMGLAIPEEAMQLFDVILDALNKNERA